MPRTVTSRNYPRIKRGSQNQQRDKLANWGNTQSITINIDSHSTCKEQEKEEFNATRYCR